MRLKRFSARTVAQAIADIRVAHGEDAVIVQIIEPETAGDFYHVVAAYEPVGETASRNADDVRLTALRKRLPLREVKIDQSVMLIGLPGVGKTLNAVRLAAAAHAQGRDVEVISFDGESAGAFAQLNSFCAPLHIPVRVLDLEAAREIEFSPERTTIVDTFGFNAFDRRDVETIAGLIAQTRLEPIWVQAAGMCEHEYAALAKICSAFGATRQIMTRMDLVRDRASALALIADHQFALGGWAASPFVDAPFLPLTYDYILQDMESAEPQYSISSDEPRKVA
jgi:flagellar biosynthesis protein FlhF